MCSICVLVASARVRNQWLNAWSLVEILAVALRPLQRIRYGAPVAALAAGLEDFVAQNEEGKTQRKSRSRSAL